MFDILLKILKFYQSIAELMFDKISEFNINNQKIPQLYFEMINLRDAMLDFSLVVTTKCNLKCINCMFRCDKIQGEDIDLDILKSSIDYYKNFIDNNVCKAQICLLGGEPLVYPYYYDILEYSNKKLKHITTLSNCIDVLNLSYKGINNLSSNMFITTKYPINIDFNKRFNLLKDTHVNSIIVCVSEQGEVKNFEERLSNDEISKFNEISYSNNVTNNTIYDCIKWFTPLKICLSIYKNKLFSCGPAVGFYIDKAHEFKEANKENNFKGDYILLNNDLKYEHIITWLSKYDLCKHCISKGLQQWNSLNYKRV